MNEEDPFPDIPEFPPGLDLHGKRRWVNRHAIEIHRHNARRWKAIGIEWVEWLGVDEPETCENCRQAHGKMMRVADLDVNEHYARCTCDDGCACCCVAVMGPE